MESMELHGKTESRIRIQRLIGESSFYQQRVSAEERSFREMQNGEREPGEICEEIETFVKLQRGCVRAASIFLHVESRVSHRGVSRKAP